jgi:hypothetical protein
MERPDALLDHMAGGGAATAQPEAPPFDHPSAA